MRCQLSHSCLSARAQAAPNSSPFLTLGSRTQHPGQVFSCFRWYTTQVFCFPQTPAGRGVCIAHHQTLTCRFSGTVNGCGEWGQNEIIKFLTVKYTASYYLGDVNMNCGQLWLCFLQIKQNQAKKKKNL